MLLYQFFSLHQPAGKVLLVGCQAAVLNEAEDIRCGLSGQVMAAVGTAVDLIHRIIDEHMRGGIASAHADERSVACTASE